MTTTRDYLERQEQRGKQADSERARGVEKAREAGVCSECGRPKRRSTKGKTMKRAITTLMLCVMITGVSACGSDPEKASQACLQACSGEAVCEQICGDGNKSPSANDNQGPGNAGNSVDDHATTITINPEPEE